MRNVVVTEFVSLDGVVDAPEEWHAPYIDEELVKSVGKRYFASDVLLLGRVTYHSFVGSWPYRTAEDFAFADHMNREMSKYVVSETLEEVEWGRWDNATLINGNVAEEVLRLKQQPGRGILVAGSVSLVQALLREDLIDEFHLLVHPVVAGKGRRLFKDADDPKRFELVDSKTLGTGVLDLTYGRARNA